MRHPLNRIPTVSAAGATRSTRRPSLACCRRVSTAALKRCCTAGLAAPASRLTASQAAKLGIAAQHTSTIQRHRWQRGKP